MARTNGRTLIATEHGAKRYMERIIGRRTQEFQSIMEDDFAGAKLLKRSERERLLFDSSARSYAWRKGGATYFLNEQTLTVFVCEAVDHRTFRLVTCFRHDAALPQKAG